MVRNGDSSDVTGTHEVTFRDELKFFFARILFRETILFSKKDDWEQFIRKKIKGYVPFFYELNEVDLNRFTLIVPLTLHAQKYLNAQQGLQTEQKALVPTNDCIDLCDDKELFHRFLVENGLESFTPRINENFGYPYILKKRIDEWGVNIAIITDPQTERAHTCAIESGDYIKQEYIEGNEEYTAHLVFDGQRAAFLKVLKFTFSEKFFIKGKNYQPVSVDEVDHRLFKAVFEDILDKVGYRGICCFNYKLVDNDLKIFEINPRYGGSLTRFLNGALTSYRKIQSDK